MMTRWSEQDNEFGPADEWGVARCIASQVHPMTKIHTMHVIYEKEHKKLYWIAGIQSVVVTYENR